MRFEDILYNESVLDGLYDMHFDECTPIQEAAIPAIMEGRDILACAQTGTGKTAAYLLPVIHELVEEGFPENQVNCVVMAPTRELAQQIDRQLQGFAYFMPISGCAIYGGTDGYTYEQQRKSLKAGADVIIATPGRLLAHLSMGYVDLSKVSFFILDEADRMLDMGFADDIMQIMSHLPKERQTLLFSATMPPKIQQLASKILNNPFEIKLAVSKPAEKIDQQIFICYETQKMPILRKLFKETPPNRAIIFSSSKLKVKQLARELKGYNLKVSEMHSDLDQIKRDDVILDFKAGKLNVIVATDILSRGIDIDDIEIVINYDVPRDPEDYIHRIGRTARADRDGKAVTFVSEVDFNRLKQIERLLEKKIPRGKVDEELGPVPDYDAKGKSRRKRPGGFKGKRGSAKNADNKNADNKNADNKNADNNKEGATTKPPQDNNKRNPNKKSYYKHKKRNNKGEVNE